MASSAEIQPFALNALQRALACSVSGGTFADTAYHLYSERQRNGKIGKPQVVYGSSIVLKTVAAYFETQLQNTDSNHEPLAKTEEYDYESDSDLDECEDAPDMTVFEGEFSDSTVTACELSPTLSELDSMDLPSEVEAAPEQTSVAEETTPQVHCKYNVVVPNVAANTWQALIHFVYTGKIHFSPLKSEGLVAQQEAKEAHRKENPHLPPLVSPKSVYRLAKMIGLASLEGLAQDDIKARLPSTDIVKELFSRFSSNHADVLDMQLELVYSNGTLAELLPQVTTAITGVCQGEKPYCNRVLTALLQKLSTLLAKPTPPEVPLSPVSSCAVETPDPVSVPVARPPSHPPVPHRAVSNVPHKPQLTEFVTRVSRTRSLGSSSSLTDIVDTSQGEHPVSSSDEELHFSRQEAVRMREEENALRLAEKRRVELEHEQKRRREANEYDKKRKEEDAMLQAERHRLMLEEKQRHRDEEARRKEKAWLLANKKRRHDKAKEERLRHQERARQLNDEYRQEQEELERMRRSRKT